MIPTYEQMGDWLEEIAQDFPEAFFEELDGGIQLEEAALPDPDFPPGEMYIMGEYVHDMLGRYILLYYGSFAALLGEEDEETWKDEIFATVAGAQALDSASDEYQAAVDAVADRVEAVSGAKATCTISGVVPPNANAAEETAQEN